MAWKSNGCFFGNKDLPAELEGLDPYYLGTGMDRRFFSSFSGELNSASKKNCWKVVSLNSFWFRFY